MTNDSPPGGPAGLSAASFRALYDRLRATVPWGAADRCGALNYLTPQRVAAAAAGVRSGRRVTMASPLSGHAPDNPEPAAHAMISMPDAAPAAHGMSFAADRLAANVHGDADSHVDALCHVSYDGFLYNGVAASEVGAGGAAELSIEQARHGIVGRGVLLDIPRLRGVGWLEPGDCVTAAELAAAEQAQGVRVGPGDLLFVRTGHQRRRRELGPWDAAALRAGLRPEALEFVAERQVAALGSDSNSDAAPSVAAGVGFPVHVLAINALGVHLLDYLQFEELLPLCEQARQWSFLCVAAPLRLPGVTGSLVNPVAVL
jgi:kynurenine formamidase